MKDITFYFDMDGVLARYRYEDYIPKEKDGQPRYKIPNEHLYLEPEPDRTAIGIFAALYSLREYFPNFHVKIFTGLGCPYLIAEHTLDKQDWLKRYLPTCIRFRRKDFLCVYGSKTEAINHLKKLSSSDILIDDYNFNLEQWRKNGGTSVKYVNGINSSRPDMSCLFDDVDVSRNLHQLFQELIADKAIPERWETDWKHTLDAALSAAELPEEE